MTKKANLNDMMDKMWQAYTKLCPTAIRVQSLLKEKSDDVINDHIALRTIRHSNAGIEKLAAPFKNLGYKEEGEYFFKEKKLYAKHLQTDQPEQPKVFISELKIEECSDFIKATFNELLDQYPNLCDETPGSVFQGRPWEIDYSTYEKLYQESEFAAWFYCHGFMPNHFTVFVNELSFVNSVEELNSFLAAQGFKMNEAGGIIKGGPDVCLAQSSTMADKIEATFLQGKKQVPGCYMEFAKRFPDSHGNLYQGFVAASADKIFESTN